AEREGKLLFLATEISPGQGVAEAHNVHARIGVLAIELRPGESREGAFAIPGSRELFRRVTEDDELVAGKLRVAHIQVRLLRLDRGDRVEAGGLLALVNPALALDELDTRVKKLDVCEADYRVAGKMKLEAEQTVESMKRSKKISPLSVSEEEFRRAKLTV